MNEQVFWDNLDDAVAYMMHHLDLFSLKHLAELYPEESALLSVRAQYGDRLGFPQLAPPTVQLCAHQIQQASDSILPVYLIFAEYWGVPEKYSEEEVLSLLEKGLPVHASNARLYLEAARTLLAIVEKRPSPSSPDAKGTTKTLDYIAMATSLDREERYRRELSAMFQKCLTFSKIHGIFHPV